MKFYKHELEEYYICAECAENILEIHELEETKETCHCVDCNLQQNSMQ
jgi:DNA-directed RNA polymerase subunit RPC12/RpoP